MDMLFTLVFAWTVIGSSGIALIVFGLVIPPQVIDRCKFLQIILTALVVLGIGSVVVVGTISVYHLIVWSQLPPTTLELLYEGQL